MQLLYSLPAEDLAELIEADPPNYSVTLSDDHRRKWHGR